MTLTLLKDILSLIDSVRDHSDYSSHQNKNKGCIKCISRNAWYARFIQQRHTSSRSHGDLNLIGNILRHNNRLGYKKTTLAPSHLDAANDNVVIRW